MIDFSAILQALMEAFHVETTTDAIWVGIGMFGQIMFTMRFLIQWIASERSGRSVVPVAFWYYSLAGGLVLLIYGIKRGEPVIILGQATGLAIYARNIVMIHQEQRALAGKGEDEDMSIKHAFGWLLGLAGAITLYRLSILFSTDLSLHGDEAQYWSWAQDLAFGYYSKPPMVAWVIAATTGLFGDSAAVVRMAAPLTYGIGAVFLFLLTQRLFDARLGLWIGIVYLTLPGVGYSALAITTDPLLLMFWAIGLYTLHRALSGEGLLWWGLTGLALGGGLLSKYAMIAFAGSLILYLLLSPSARSHWRSPGPWLALGLGLLLFLPNILWNLENGLATFSHTGDNANLDGPLFRPEKFLAFLGGQFGVFGPILFAFLAWLLVVRGKRLLAEPRLAYLVAFTVPLLAVMLAQSFLSRAHANWAAASYVAGAVLVGAVMLRLPRLVAIAPQWGRRLVVASVALHATAAFLVYHYDFITANMGLERSKGNDPYRALRGWDQLARAVEAYREQYPEVRMLFDDRMIMASMLYEMSPHPFDAVKWNPDDSVDDHYELVTGFEGAEGQDFLLLARHSGMDKAVTPFFQSVEALTRIEIQVLPDDIQGYDLYLCQHYQQGGGA